MVMRDFYDFLDINYLSSLMERHKRELSIGISVLVLMAGGGFYYYNYRISQQELAQKAFFVCIQEFERANKNVDLWPEAELAAVTGYRQHSGSSLAPYFLALQAQALVRQ